MYLLEHRNPHGDRFYPARREPVLGIVMHITAGLQGRPGEADASAERAAAYAASTDRKVSWHSGSDSDSWLQLLPDEYVAWHCAGANSVTVGHEISKRDASWTDEDPRWVAATLQQAAACLRERAAALNVPLRQATPAELADSRAYWRATGKVRPVGFLSHASLDPARRSDPGADFPWNRFLALLARSDPQEDFMPLTDADVLRIAAATSRMVQRDLAVVIRGDAEKPGATDTHPYNLEALCQSVTQLRADVATLLARQPPAGTPAE